MKSKGDNQTSNQPTNQLFNIDDLQKANKAGSGDVKGNDGGEDGGGPAVSAGTPPVSPTSWNDLARDGFVGSVGKTPLIRLRGPSEETGCNILAKVGGHMPDTMFLLAAGSLRHAHTQHTHIHIHTNTHT
jgi:hypothetical protein